MEEWTRSRAKQVIVAVVFSHVQSIKKAVNLMLFIFTIPNFCIIPYHKYVYLLMI